MSSLPTPRRRPRKAEAACVGGKLLEQAHPALKNRTMIQMAEGRQQPSAQFVQDHSRLSKPAWHWDPQPAVMSVQSLHEPLRAGDCCIYLMAEGMKQIACSGSSTCIACPEHLRPCRCLIGAQPGSVNRIKRHMLLAIIETE